MNEHKKINKLLASFALGELSAEAQTEIKAHLSVCPQCASELKRLEALLGCAGRIGELSADARTCESAKQAVFTAIKSEEMKPARKASTSLKFIWGTIVKSRITKVAIPAVVAVGVILAWFYSSVSITSPAFGVEDVLDAMRKAKWMHIEYEIAELNADPNAIGKAKRQVETWISVDPRRLIVVRADGSIDFSDEELGKTASYDPETNTITLTTYEANMSNEQASSIGDLLLKQLSELEKRGDKVTYSDAIYQDKLVTRIDVDRSDESGAGQRMSMFVDPQTHLPRKLTFEQVASGQRVVASGIFDYPERGPTDIYEAGAPRDAELKTIDRRPTPAFVEAIRPYREAREKLVSKYVLITTRISLKDFIDTVNVIYNDGRQQRFEHHSVFKPGDAIDQMWAVHSTAMGRTFESLLDWARKAKSGSTTIYLYDGQYYYRFERDDAGKWTSGSRQYWPDFNPIPDEDLAELGWPLMSTQGKVVENDYSQAHNLLCAETRSEHQIRDGKLMISARRNLFYLDPEHGYICRRVEVFAHLQPSAATPVDELDFDPAEIPSEPCSITEITELGQTDTGQWYPLRIEHRTPSRLSSVTRTYLRTDCEFPEDIFDPDKVISEAGQAGPVQRKSYKQIFSEAIGTIDSLESWPEPGELVEQYWQARAAKDYDKLAVFWPGSATWNQRVLADEKPVEYVAGQAQEAGEVGVNVPYASKNYYEEHGTYNLIMRLTNEKSAKGRYYIYSGN